MVADDVAVLFELVCLRDDEGNYCFETLLEASSIFDDDSDSISNSNSDSDSDGDLPTGTVFTRLQGTIWICPVIFCLLLFLLVNSLMYCQL